jgi:hypothetical protein
VTAQRSYDASGHCLAANQRSRPVVVGRGVPCFLSVPQTLKQGSLPASHSIYGTRLQCALGVVRYPCLLRRARYRGRGTSERHLRLPSATQLRFQSSHHSLFAYAR